MYHLSLKFPKHCFDIHWWTFKLQIIMFCSASYDIIDLVKDIDNNINLKLHRRRVARVNMLITWTDILFCLPLRCLGGKKPNILSTEFHFLLLCHCSSHLVLDMANLCSQSLTEAFHQFSKRKERSVKSKSLKN